MFILYAEKTRLSVQKSEPVTSGSVNVYPVRFQFSPDWDGMVPTAVFRADWKTYAVVLDQNGECVIPWEALAKPRCRLEAGVYGARDGNVVLPTIWADLGTILEGAGPGEPARPPTAGVLEQVMGELAAVRQLVAALKAPDHGLLPGRDAADQHPIQAVAGLEDALARVPSAMTAQELEDILKGSGEEPPPAEGAFLGRTAAAALWERIGEALEAQGYFSAAVPLSWEYQDYMRTYCHLYGCPYPMALAVADWETRGQFNMDAIGPAGEVGIMQLNPGPDGSYHAELEDATGLDPTTPEGNIAGGCYKLGKYMAEYGDAAMVAMAYNRGQAGARAAWEAGITSNSYTDAVLEALERWECAVNAWAGE